MSPRQRSAAPGRDAAQSRPVAAPVAPVAVGGVTGLLALHRAAGNAAVAQRLSRPANPEQAARWTAAMAVQRNVENATYRGTVQQNEVAAAWFNAVNVAAAKAYQYAVSVPSLGGYKGLNGHTEHWHRLWTSFVSGGRPKLMAAAFGYVIESLVSEELSPYRPSPPPGFSVIPQVTAGSTRPDLVLRLTKGGAEVAWLDLTASESVDHIYDKAGWSAKIPIFAEVTYDSLDPGTLSLMVQNKDKAGPMSPDEFEKKRAVAQAAYDKRKAHWVALGKDLQYGKLRQNVMEARGIFLRDQLELHPEWKRGYIAEKLQDQFATEELPEDKMVPSILAAMKVNPGSWGYTTGYNVSERAGEAWLVDNEAAAPDGSGGQDVERSAMDIVG